MMDNWAETNLCQLVLICSSLLVRIYEIIYEISMHISSISSPRDMLSISFKMFIAIFLEFFGKIFNWYKSSENWVRKMYKLLIKWIVCKSMGTFINISTHSNVFSLIHIRKFLQSTFNDLCIFHLYPVLKQIFQKLKRVFAY